MATLSDEARGMRFRVETACDGYASLQWGDVPDDIFDVDSYIEGARAAADAIRAALASDPTHAQDGGA